MIQLGQDAQGKWAFMLYEPDGEMVASGQGYRDAHMALDHALSEQRMRERERRQDA